jgi:hypothetical protein
VPKGALGLDDGFIHHRQVIINQIVTTKAKKYDIIPLMLEVATISLDITYTICLHKSRGHPEPVREVFVGYTRLQLKETSMGLRWTPYLLFGQRPTTELLCFCFLLASISSNTNTITSLFSSHSSSMNHQTKSCQRILIRPI